MKKATAQEPARVFKKAAAIAKQIGVCTKTVHTLGRKGCFPRYIVNQRIVLYDVDEVLAFVEKAKTCSTSVL